MSPHDKVLTGPTMETHGDILLGGSPGDRVVSIESGVISFCAYGYCPTWRTSYSDDSLGALSKDVKGIADGDPKAIHMTVCVTNLAGEKVYYTGLQPDEPLPKTGTKVVSGQVLGRLGHAYPGMGPALRIQGADLKGTNRLLSLLKSPWPLLEVQKPKARTDRVSQGDAQKDFDVFWGALRAYYPGLYDHTTRTDLEAAALSFRAGIPGKGLSKGDFQDRLRDFMDLFSDNHMSLWSPGNEADGKYLPFDFALVGDRLLVTMSEVKAVPVGTQIVSIDGVPAKGIIENLWSRGGRSDGALGTWEREVLGRFAGNLWAHASRHAVGDTVPVVLENGRTSKVTLRRLPVKGAARGGKTSMEVARSRGAPIPGLKDSATIVIRRIAADTDALSIGSFSWSDMDTDLLDAYFSGRGGPLPANLIIDLRNNPGGEERHEWKFLGYFCTKPFYPFVSKAVVRNTIAATFGALNFIDNDALTFRRFTVEEDGAFHLRPDESDLVLPFEQGSFAGSVVVLSNGMTGSAAFDAVRQLRTLAGAVVVGRPGPHGTNRMIAEKFAQVQLPASGLSCQIPMVKMVTEAGGGEGPPVPMRMDYPVELSFGSILQKEDPEWDKALEVLGVRTR